jgi:hypothetical protein
MTDTKFDKLTRSHFRKDQPTDAMVAKADQSLADIRKRLVALVSSQHSFTADVRRVPAPAASGRPDSGKLVKAVAEMSRNDRDWLTREMSR